MFPVSDIFQLLLFVILLTLLAVPFGAFMLSVYTNKRTLRVYSRQLRLNIESDPSRPRHIITEPGVGYRLL